MNRVTVLGSLNLDTTIRMKELPKPGETVHSDEVFSSGGGKGANQAIAAQRSNAMTSFIGAVGNDEQGKLLIDLLAQDGVDVSGITTLEAVRTGSAIVMVDSSGENSIIVHAGANNLIDVKKENLLQKLKKTDYLISQFEINLNAIEEAFVDAKKLNTQTILNPAPAIKDIPKNILTHTDVIIPNLREAEIITGLSIKTDEDLNEAATMLQNDGIQLVIITLGKEGTYYKLGNQFGKILAKKVHAVDTTGAGDTFIGALSSILKPDFSNVIEAIEYATKASSITVQRFGAQPSIPYKTEIDNEYDD